jgi:hypothetical protein
MTQSALFAPARRRNLEAEIAKLLARQPDFLSSRTAGSPRAVGDAIQSILSENLERLLGDFVHDYSADFARRAMADLAFSDRDGLYYRIDVKTHRADTKFNMPNLTSVERLASFYEDDSNFFVILLVKYVAAGGGIAVQDVTFVPIEFLGWDCLTIGALGWGQIQIANANRVTVIDESSRRSWMLDMCDAMLEFYPKEVAKISERTSYFEQVRERWQSREE